MKRRGSTRSGVYIRRVLCSLKVCKMMHKFFCPSHQIVHNSLPKDFEISIFKKPKTYCSVCVSPLRDWVGNRCLSLLLSSSCLYSYKIIYILTGWSVLRLKFIANRGWAYRWSRQFCSFAQAWFSVTYMQVWTFEFCEKHLPYFIIKIGLCTECIFCIDSLAKESLPKLNEHAYGGQITNVGKLN